VKLIPPIILIVYILYLVTHRDFVFDQSDWKWSYETFSDQVEQGNSMILEQKVFGESYVVYRVGTSYAYPYVGCGYSAKDTSHFVDISKYSKVIFELDSSCTNLNVSLNYFVSGFSRIDNGSTQQQTMNEIVIQKGITTYEIPIRRFTTQQWWYMMNNLTSSDIPELDYKRLCGINFTNHPSMEQGTVGVVAVKRIVFRRGVGFEVVLSLLLLCAWFVVPLLYRKLKHRQGELFEGATFVAYEKSEIGMSPRSKQITELAQLKHFFAVEYKNPRISLEFAEQQLNIPQHRIRALTKELSKSGF